MYYLKPMVHFSIVLRPLSASGALWFWRNGFSCHFLGADEEAFEDNSEEYIRRDLEGSGMQSLPLLGWFFIKLVSHLFKANFPAFPPQISTLAAELRVTWCGVCVNSLRGQLQRSSLVTSAPCWQSTPKIPAWTGSIKTLLYISSRR